jgi:hypothetical protein
VASLADLLIHHLVPEGEAWLPVKAEPDFSHGERLRCLRVATLLKTSLLPSSPWDASGETPDLGLLDQTMATHGPFFLLRASFLEQTLVGGGSEVERRASFLVYDGGSWRCGAAESR